MASENGSGEELAAALRGLPETERAVFLAMLDERATYPAIGARLGIGTAEAEAAFAAALVRLAQAIDAPAPVGSVRSFLRRLAAAARLARHRSRR